MDRNESPKFKINQNNGCGNINTVGSKPSSSEKENDSVSSLKQDRDNLDRGKNLNHLPTENPEIFPDSKVDFGDEGDANSFLLSKKTDLTNQAQGSKLENQSDASSVSKEEFNRSSAAAVRARDHEGKENSPKDEYDKEGKINEFTCVPNGVYFKFSDLLDVETKDIVEYFTKYGPVKDITFYGLFGTGKCVYENKIDATSVLQRENVYIKNAKAIVRPLLAKSQEYNEQYRLDPDAAQFLRSRRTLETTVADMLTEMDQIYKLNRQKVIKIKQDLSAQSGYRYPAKIPGCRVFIFGSQVNVLATGKSDCDIYIDYDGNSFFTKLSNEKQQGILQHLQYQLNQWGSKFLVKEVILTARVPIIRAVHLNTNFLCDIACHSGLGVVTSDLVTFYLALDIRVRWLVVAVKLWMQANGLLDRQVFTSYATVWLVLFFLMTRGNPVVCPVVTLQKNCMPTIVAGWDCRFFRDVRDAHRSFRTFNTESEIKLLANFFETYAAYPFRASVLCPLTGNLLKRKQFESDMDKIQCSKTAERLKINTPICLQDPFDLSHNITKGVKQEDLDRFQALCDHSYNMLRKNLLAG